MTNPDGRIILISGTVQSFLSSRVPPLRPLHAGMMGFNQGALRMLRGNETEVGQAALNKPSAMGSGIVGENQSSGS